MVKYLISEGANPTQSHSECLYWAQTRQHSDIVEYLKKYINFQGPYFRWFEDWIADNREYY